MTVRATIQWLTYERTGDVASLDAAEADADEALAAMPLGHVLRSSALYNTGMIAFRRYERTGNLAVLERAIGVLRQAVDATDHDYARPAHLSTLGMSLGRRFERKGAPGDLDDAIDYLREAVVTSSSRNDRPVWLSNFAAYLCRRFERTGDEADIDEAVEAGREAVSESGDHSGRARSHSNLGGSLLARHARFRRMADIDEAVENMRSAAHLAVPGQVGYPMHLMNLGLAFRERFGRTGELPDAEASVRYCREALKALPDGHPDVPFYLANLSACLDTLADHTEDRDAAAEALKAARAAVEAIEIGDPDHPEYARYLRALGNALQTRYDLDADRADLTAAFDTWRQATRVATASPGQRLEIAQHWGRTAARAGMFAEATNGLSTAVGILPSVVWHGLDPVTRQRQAARWAGLAADAACCAVLDGQPELAVELLEQGRSMLWRQALGLRADHGDLARVAPELAERMEVARTVLNTPIPLDGLGAVDVGLPGHGVVGVGGFKSSRQEAVDRLRGAARDYDAALAEIREMEGFEHYLETAPYPELAAASVDGAVVIVNISRYGCHAIIVAAESDRARVVDLPDLDLDSAEDRARHLSQLLDNRRRGRDRPFPARERDRRALLDILGWLWDVIAAPVLDTLTDQRDPARIWWCPTGPLVSLPLHAAGQYPRLRTEHQGAATMLARTVSSYIPTLSSLRRARGFLPPEHIRQLTVAIPAVEDRAGFPPLPDVTTELKHLTQHFPPGPANHQLVESLATRDAVIAAMAAHDWIHLACHAGPLRSGGTGTDPGFVLSDGDLTITDLAAQPGRRGGLAFLSACQTATGSEDHLDEALHLAAAMQFLGYSHVIATMWSIADSPAPLVTDLFYTALRQDGNHAASALRHAVIRLRDESDPSDPFVWAPYVHVGC